METTNASEGLRLSVNRSLICSVLGGGFAFLMLASLGQDLLAWAALPIGHTYILDVDVEGGAFAWASSLVLDLNALVLLAQWSTARAARAAWLALAIGFLSLDEMVGVHERIGGVLGAVMQPRGSFYFVWLAPALVAVAALAIVFRSFRLHLPRRMAWQFVAAGGLYVGGAVGVEMISGVVAEGGSMQRRRRNLKNGPHTTDDLNRAQLAPIQRQ